jgi:hypothetical protein
MVREQDQPAALARDFAIRPVFSRKKRYVLDDAESTPALTDFLTRA